MVELITATTSIPRNRKRAAQNDIRPAIRIVSAQRIGQQQQVKQQICGSLKQEKRGKVNWSSLSFCAPGASAGGNCFELVYHNATREIKVPQMKQELSRWRRVHSSASSGSGSWPALAVVDPPPSNDTKGSELLSRYADEAEARSQPSKFDVSIADSMCSFDTL
eukprot:CAMPEP_0170595842 /NCGR_PEP_ID=MMETSP0224-20130122/14781_1 /TAXON_ID=285029 /ORGANISM="Togula jolla, Strain CCCM 725" /LENGTH=163 /DNA_ID=CAMNT_0010920057 /DNA_START=267 /DNA_END=758 /DNA_ORIENTATION=-